MTATEDVEKIKAMVLQLPSEELVKTIRNSQFAIRNYVLQWGFRPQRKTSNPRGWGIKPL